MINQIWRFSAMVLFLAGGDVAAQVSGRVIDGRSGEPLGGANISCGEFVVQSGSKGEFALTQATADSVVVSFVGYETARFARQDDNLLVRLMPIVIPAAEVIVSGLRDAALNEAAASVTVLNRGRIQSAGNLHAQDLTASVANLNWAGSTSRPRYFQIRGIGGRSQYVGEGPPNFSVGFVMDDVDLSGLGGAGVLFDLEQLEVFKGPQSTIFGPNAMAGMINLQSADPVGHFGYTAVSSFGTDALQHYSGAVNVPLATGVAARFGFHSARSDGFRDNAFLNRTDTNRRRETFARAKLLYDLPNGISLKGTLFRADLDNGFDAWATDNNEELITQTDNPGKDHQRTTGLSLRGEVPLDDLNADLVSITAFSTTDLEYSFDADWGNNPFWLERGFDPEVEGWHNAFFDKTLRDRRVFSQELRLLKDRFAGGQAIAGVYFKDLEETDDATSFLFGSGVPLDHKGTFAIDDLAAYGQYDRDLSSNLSVSLNARVDRMSTSYSGSTANEAKGNDPVDFDVSDWLFGGKAAAIYRVQPSQTLFGGVSRGFRPGGINQRPGLAAANRPYDPEYMTNLEVGWYYSGTRATTTVSVFHSWRSRQQVSLSSQQDPTNPTTFYYYTANASTGRSTGLELEQTIRLIPALRLSGSLGLLKTHVDEYTFLTGEDQETGEGQEVSRGDRAAAHGPEYNVRIGADYDHLSGVFAQLELTAMDKFFFSDSHDQVSDPYQLVNGRVGYRWDQWKITLWGRNLLDERYAVRGFFFGLEPPLWNDKLYKSYGDPRQWGVSLATEI